MLEASEGPHILEVLQCQIYVPVVTNHSANSGTERSDHAADGTRSATGGATKSTATVAANLAMFNSITNLSARSLQSLRPRTRLD